MKLSSLVNCSNIDCISLLDDTKIHNTAISVPIDTATDSKMWYYSSDPYDIIIFGQLWPNTIKSRISQWSTQLLWTRLKFEIGLIHFPSQYKWWIVPRHPTESLKIICGITVMTLTKLSSLDNCNERVYKTETEERMMESSLWCIITENISWRFKWLTEAKAGIGATEERISFIHIQTPLNKTKAVFIDD